jgi:hypothetical protein
VTSAACPAETLNGGKYVGRQTLRFVLIREVSCAKAHSLIRALYNHVASGSCEGNRCITELPRGWACGFFVGPESEELGNAVGGCFRSSTGAKVRVYSALEGFLSPNRKIWCSGGFSRLPGSPPEVGCVTSGAVRPLLGGIVSADGAVTLCTEAPREVGHPAPWGCYQNFDRSEPILPYGEAFEGGGFRCASGRDGITCTVVSGEHAGKGFRIDIDEIAEVGADRTGP